LEEVLKVLEELKAEELNNQEDLDNLDLPEVDVESYTSIELQKLNKEISDLQFDLENKNKVLYDLVNKRYGIQQQSKNIYSQLTKNQNNK
jgi:hypothetical protein